MELFKSISKSFVLAITIESFSGHTVNIFRYISLMSVFECQEKRYINVLLLLLLLLL